MNACSYCRERLTNSSQPNDGGTCSTQVSSCDDQFPGGPLPEIVDRYGAGGPYRGGVNVGAFGDFVTGGEMWKLPAGARAWVTRHGAVDDQITCVHVVCYVLAAAVHLRRYYFWDEEKE